MREKIMLVAGFALALGACTSEENQTVPFTGPSPDAAASISSPKALIAFSSDREGSAQVYTMTSNGKKPTRLTNGEGSGFSPAWSPDRTRIAFTRFPSAGGSEIYVMNSDGTNVTLLATAASRPDWSPDGSKIAFVRNGTIVVANADGTNQVALPQGEFDNDDEPDWSPDGTKLVITRDRGATQSFDLWVIDADGNNPVQLTSVPPTQETSAAWSPDGSRIAFVTDQAGPAFQVFVMNADGSDQTQLTTTSANFEPSWAPDGSKIVFSSFRDGNSELYVMDPDGAEQRRLTNNPASDLTPAWAP
jgi:Tol biopolymer transport system component